uniref:hypothetical protein ycf38 n=1 Tax=Nemalion vermiculare TaxID=935621 RepID=UPI002580AB5F|nr:hypothetical protein ycf38 [Nemalion vermiculare]WGV34352.1 hypothetical protein ycf38 [Nemalion vermiculare]
MTEIKKEKEYSVLTPNFDVRSKNGIIKAYTNEIYSLTIRLFIQSWRRPSLLITGIVQPLLWLLLFSALFQNAPIELFTSTTRYSDFISSGIIVFTAFTSALNAGLPLIFDREFGFFNRILSSHLYSRYSIILSSSINILFSSFIQVASIIFISWLLGNKIPSINNGLLTILVLFLLSNSVTSLSLTLAFILPGHIEMLACILIINLPLLFSSTALAPLVFMPSWLQILASVNPLSYAIEMIRYAYLHESYHYSSVVINTLWGSINTGGIIAILSLVNILSFVLSYKLISSKFED